MPYLIAPRLRQFAQGTCFALCFLLSSSLLAQHQITSMDFQRTGTGQARLLLTFAGPPPQAQLSQTEQGELQVEFAHTQIEAALLNQFDARDFATPVTQIALSQGQETGRVSLTLQEPMHHVISQLNQQWILDLSRITDAEDTSTQRRFRYTGERMSFQFQEIPVRQLLTLIAEELELNLIAGPAVSGNISLRLEDIPSDQALDLILTTQNLASRQTGNVLYVAPASELTQLAAQESAAARAAEGLAPLEERFIRIRYADAAGLRRFLLDEAAPSVDNHQFAAALGYRTEEAPAPVSSNRNPRFMSDRGQLLVDERTNTLYIRDTQEQLDRIQAIVERLDVPVEQIMIEARIVVARSGASDELGINWSGGRVSGGSGSQEITGNPSLGRALELDTSLTGRRGSSGSYNPSTGATFGFVSNNFILDLELAALETENRSEVISQPRVMTSDRHMAVIRSGEEIPYQVTDGDGNVTTNFRQAELRLEVTPQNVGDGRIALNLRVNNDSRAQDTTDAGPVINTNAVETQVLIENGSTLAIGGIYTTQNLTQKSQTPFLGDLPIIGWLFRHSIQRQENVELLIFITPRLVNSSLARN